MPREDSTTATRWVGALAVRVCKPREWSRRGRAWRRSAWLSARFVLREGGIIQPCQEFRNIRRIVVERLTVAHGLYSRAEQKTGSTDPKAIGRSLVHSPRLRLRLALPFQRAGW